MMELHQIACPRCKALRCTCPTYDRRCPKCDEYKVYCTCDRTNPKDLVGVLKAPLRLVPPALLLAVSQVMALGAKKYGQMNWRSNDVKLSIYIEAAMRHLLALQDGQDTDPESGQPHAAHAAACMGIILDAGETGNLIDDRPKPGPAAAMIDRTNGQKVVS